MSQVHRPLGALAVVAIVLAALNLRPAVVVISPLLGEIRLDLGLSAGAAGLLTTLPVLCFGLLAAGRPAAMRPGDTALRSRSV